ncbi:MAG: hypothetical protein WC389_18705 [Lutibacter sp.]|jgi:uncharacterized coiled-coil protein SlyX
MPDVKITSELLEVLKTDRMALITDINSGKVKGKIMPPSTILIDSDEIPEEFRQRFIEKPPEKVNEPVKSEATLPQKNNKPDAETTLSLSQQTDNIKAETSRLKALIEYEIIKKERDRPEILTQKEATLAELEKTLTQRQMELDEQKLKLDGRETVIAGKEQELKDKEQSVNVRVASEELTIKKMYDEKDAEILKRQKELDDIEKSVDREKMVLQNINNAIDEAKKEIPPLTETLKALTKTTLKYIDYHERKGQNTNGEHEQWNFGKRDQYWKLKETCRKILNDLQQVLGIK